MTTRTGNLTMTFLALLTKEMRLRLRRERTMWVIIAYLLFMGLLGWVAIGGTSNPGSNGPGNLSQIGLNLYLLLSQLQMFLIIFIAPAFTVTAVNGEKERQTFDLLLCSRLSSFSLVAGKLLAGLANALLLVAASAPLFSLVFFFGGVAPSHILNALIIYVITILLVGTFSLFCSIVFPRPSVSTAVAYTACLLWVALPIIATFIISIFGMNRWFQLYPNRTHLLYLWNPITSLNSTYPSSSAANYYPSSGSYYGLGVPGYSYVGNLPYTLGQISLTPWQAYSIVSLALAAILFLLCTLLIKTSPFPRSRRFAQKITGGARAERA
ncbi:MAG: ABC transporter permease subunit [Ktedonobacteraceae bacterium]|nr:ABC transporter permease subunit [Ktedonobacteraceae bacterium]